jgi:hypothetical protein
LLCSGAAQLSTCSLVFCYEAAVVRRNPSREWEPRLTSWFLSMLRGFAPEPRVGHVWASDLSRINFQTAILLQDWYQVIYDLIYSWLILKNPNTSLYSMLKCKVWVIRTCWQCLEMSGRSFQDLGSSGSGERRHFNAPSFKRGLYIPVMDGNSPVTRLVLSSEVIILAVHLGLGMTLDVPVVSDNNIMLIQDLKIF